MATAYARAVVSGQRVAGALTQRACARQLRDLERWKRDPTWPYVWDRWHAEDICDFIEKLPHVEGRWATPTITLEPWQCFILTTVWGWRRKTDGGRRFSTAYIEVARKNAKSTLTAGVALYCLTCEDEPGAQVLAAATTGQQARKVFTPARHMVERTPLLREAKQVQPWANAITCGLNGGTFQPINARSSTQDGWNPHVAIIDELHAHKDRSLFDVLKSARGARANPLSWYITTAGFHLDSVCYEQRQLLVKILDGVLEGEHYFGIIFTLDEGDDPFDARVWGKANPNLGVSVRDEELAAYALEARHSPDSLGTFRTKRLNVWAGAASAWLNLAQWDACADATLALDQFVGQPCWIGVDLSDRNDITAVVLLFEREGLPVLLPWFYLPRDLVAARMGTTAGHYAAWAQEGYLQLTEGDFIDHNRVEADLRQWMDRFAVQAIVFDQYGSAQMAAKFVTEGVPAWLEPKTAARWTPPATEFDARVRSRRLVHPGHPVLRWMASNVVVSRRVDGSVLTKKESAMSPNKIDGIDAAIMAMSRWVLRGDEASVYERESRGVWAL